MILSRLIEEKFYKFVVRRYYKFKIAICCVTFNRDGILLKFAR